MLFIIGFTLGIIWNSNNFYLFDSNSRDSNGNPAIDGAVILLKYNSLLYIDEFINLEKQLFLLLPDSVHLRFLLQGRHFKYSS